MGATFSLSGRTALVTGAGRGLGLAIACGLAEAGAFVYLNGRHREPLDAAVEDLRSRGFEAQILTFDVTDADRREAALAALSGTYGHGGIDILVNNVGLRDRRDVFAFAAEDMRNMLDANVVAPFELCRAVGKTMIERGGGGRIINITSIAGHVARPGDATYTAAKAGLTGLTRALAAELGPHAITVNAIAPGYFATEQNAEMVTDEGVAQFLKARTSLGRWGRPEEVAGAAVFLASDVAAYVTGHVLVVDGGMTAHF